MNESLIQELKNAIEKLKVEILEKQQKLNSLIDKYQELSGIEIYEDINNEDLEEY